MCKKCIPVNNHFEEILIICVMKISFKLMYSYYLDMCCGHVLYNTGNYYHNSVMPNSYYHMHRQQGNKATRLS